MIKKSERRNSDEIIFLLDVVACGVPPVFVQPVQMKRQSGQVVPHQQAEHHMGPQRAAISHSGVQRQQRWKDGVFSAKQQHLFLVCLDGWNVVVLRIAGEKTQEHEQ